MIKIGLTGGIASGKTTIVEYLMALGVKVIDADLIAREVLGIYPEIHAYLKETYGDVVFREGILDRKALGKIIFLDKEEREKYNAVIMPRIKKLVEKRFRELKDEKYVILDAPLLFEEKFDKNMDITITVYVEKDAQLKRLMKRDNLTEKEALTRVQSQMDMREKVRKSTYVVNNSGELIDTLAELTLVLKKIGFENEK